MIERKTEMKYKNKMWNATTFVMIWEKHALLLPVWLLTH